MTIRPFPVLVLAAATVLPFASLCHAQAPTEPIATVHVPYVRDPVDKSYRKMIKGMDRFERERALAPAAVLRFRLLPRLPNADMGGITLRIAGDRLTLPVALAADNSFTLPRNEQAVREDAAVVANRKSTAMTWRAWVHTPGLPAGTRRLGDLRLECRVGMDSGLISNTSPMFAWLTNALTDTDKICTTDDGNYLFFADRPVFSVTLRHGARSEVLPFKLLYAGGNETPESLPYCDCQVLLDRSYYAPIWDQSWPDDTLVEFEYMDQPAGAAP
ncbi:MAG: hypothetical protein ACXWVG_00205 [Telluria sp.]